MHCYAGPDSRQFVQSITYTFHAAQFAPDMKIRPLSLSLDALSRSKPGTCPDDLWSTDIFRRATSNFEEIR